MWLCVHKMLGHRAGREIAQGMKYPFETILLSAYKLLMLLVLNPFAFYSQASPVTIVLNEQKITESVGTFS